MEHTQILNPIGLSDSVTEKAGSIIHRAGITVLMVFLGIIVGYVIAKNKNYQDELLARANQSAAGPFVRTARVTRSSGERVIKEIGEARPYAFATLYAKVSGYLKEIYIDKGDLVKAGQILATIESPETDSQYQAAQADLKNKKAQAERMVQLHRTLTVTDEERDSAVANADIAAARLEELRAVRGYTTLISPFDGTVTARFADPGNLVQDAANARSGALPIVTISQTDRLRVTTFIDQRDAAFVRVGDPATITLLEKPGVQYDARVTRMAGELDTRSRTMLTEIELANPGGDIVTGGFVDITLKVKSPSGIQVPSQALIMRGNQAYVCTVGSDSQVHYRHVEVSDNDGTVVNILSGIEEGENVVLNMGNSLLDGQNVQIDNGA